MKKQIRILLVEDNAADTELIKLALRKDGLAFSLRQVDTRDDYLRTLESAAPDVILSDYYLPLFDGFAALTLAQEKHPDLPFIFVTGALGEEVAIKTLKHGATDFVLKSRLSRLGPVVRRALREARERAIRKRATEELRALSLYLQQVREQECTRIARAVHDELGQALTGLKIDLAWLAGRLPRQLHPLLDKTRDMSARIDETIQAVRRIATELRPGILDHLGLVAAIEWQANEFQTRTGIQCKVAHTLIRTVPDGNLSTVFFRIFQETLTNIVRHADATRVEVDLYEEEGRLVLEVRDNGRGITSEQAANIESIGLLGMRERAARLGGRVDIIGHPKSGTKITVSIPCAAPPRAHKRHHENSFSR